jgi:hypothetical protein
VKAVSIRLSRRGFFVVAVVIGPLLGCVAVMLVSDGLGLVRGDSPWIVVVGLALPAVFAAGIGKVARRSPNEIVLAAAGSVAVTSVVAVTLFVIWWLTLPPNFFN